MQILPVFLTIHLPASLHDAQNRPDLNRLLLQLELHRHRFRERPANRHQAVHVAERVAYHLVLVDVKKVAELDGRDGGDGAAWGVDDLELVDVDVLADLRLALARGVADQEDVAAGVAVSVVVVCLRLGRCGQGEGSEKGGEDGGTHVRFVRLFGWSCVEIELV